VQDPRGVEAAVVVLHIDGRRTDAIGSLRDGNGELSVWNADPLEERVAATESQAAADEHVGIAAELRRLHGRLRHSRGP
jgi:hypothetical protein